MKERWSVRLSWSLVCPSLQLVLLSYPPLITWTVSSSLMCFFIDSSPVTLCDTWNDEIKLEGLLGSSIQGAALSFYWCLLFNTLLCFLIVSSLAKVVATLMMWHRWGDKTGSGRALELPHPEEPAYPASTTSHGLLRPCAVLSHCPWTRIAFRIRGVLSNEDRQTLHFISHFSLKQATLARAIVS